MITVKSESELKLMREAGKLLADTLGQLAEACRPGVTTNDIDQQADTIIRGQGAIPGFLGYNGFPKSLCISVNEEVVHGIPGERVIENGDIVSLDCGLIYKGLWADSGRTVMVGEVDAEAKRLVEVTRRSLERGIEQAVAGNRVGDISAAVQKEVEAAGFSVVRNFVGHGIGRNMHEEPQVPNFGVPGTGPLLRAGYALAIEPMVNQGTHEVQMLEDHWTIITADHKLSAYFEHTVLITDDGPIVATAA
ncbi:MAG: type I methionyl aminopeptidase [Candidatus Dormibacteraeota bacterium]|nr:type I methionyl aminopeptidase [Candidatus Dormibacteraeota bacterium]